MPNTDFPLAKRVSPVYLINGALYVRKTSGEAMDNPDAIRARVAGSGGTERVSWFAAADEGTVPTDESVPEDCEGAMTTDAPKIAATGS